MWKMIRLASSLILFGLAIGILTALNTNVGATTALVAALFGLVGGSLVTLYSPSSSAASGREEIIPAAAPSPNTATEGEETQPAVAPSPPAASGKEGCQPAPTASGSRETQPAVAPYSPDANDTSREGVIQAAGLISLGLLLGLALGIWLRFLDEGVLKMALVREWAATDRELRKHGQHLGQFMGAGAEGDKGKDGPINGLGPVSSVVLHRASEPTIQTATQELDQVIANLGDKKETAQAKNELIECRKVIRDSSKQPTAEWLVKVAQAESRLSLMTKDSAANALKTLREEVMSPKK
jgi:hypothetical protein